jgi:hypothetical protein
MGLRPFEQNLDPLEHSLIGHPQRDAAVMFDLAVASTGRPAAGRLRPRYQMITQYRGFRAPTVPVCGFALPVVL